MTRFFCILCMLLLSAAPGPAIGGTAFVVVDADGAPLQYAVITASGGTAGDARAAPVEVAQRQQQFDPRVVAVRRGTSVNFPNADITQHHVYSFSDAKPFELELYSGDDANPVLFDRSGIVALGCNIHDWMLGYVYVTDDEHFAVSDVDGSVELDVDTDRIDSITLWHPAAVHPEPQRVRLDSLPTISQQTYRIEVDTTAHDPLAFEVDPLQSLFEDAP